MRVAMIFQRVPSTTSLLTSPTTASTKPIITLSKTLTPPKMTAAANGSNRNQLEFIFSRSLTALMKYLKEQKKVNTEE